MKRLNWRWAARALWCAGIATLVACGGGGSAPPAPVPVAPSFTQQPVSQSVAAGGSVTFAVAASGDAPLSYQWQRNGVDIAGAGSSTFTLGNVLVPDQGAGFAAKVSNGAGSVVSSTATLSVQAAGTLTLVAGTTTVSQLTPSFADGPAASARFSDGIKGLAVNGAGDIFVTDTYNHVVRRISANGVVSTFAGTPGVRDLTGVAGFNLPAGLAIDSAGTLYLADNFPSVFGIFWLAVRAISAQGVVRVVAGRIFTASLAVDAADNLYIPVGRISPDGQASGIDTSAAVQAQFNGHAVGADGTYYFASGNSIWKNPPGSGSMLLAGASSFGTADGPAQQARFAFLDGGIPIPQYQVPMAADSVGNLYLCDASNLRRVAKDGLVTTLTGRPGMLAGIGVGGLEDQPFSMNMPPGRPTCGGLALRGDRTLYIGRGPAVLKLQLP